MLPVVNLVYTRHVGPIGSSALVLALALRVSPIDDSRTVVPVSVLPNVTGTWTYSVAVVGVADGEHAMHTSQQTQGGRGVLVVVTWDERTATATGGTAGSCRRDGQTAMRAPV